METSHQVLSIESFSYSWLVNLKPSLESLDNNSLRSSLDASDEANSFIEMDPRMPPSKRFITNSLDFNFDFPISQSPLALVHADELFSDGYVMPVFVDQMKMKMDSFEAVSDSHGSKLAVQGSEQADRNCSSMTRCRKFSKRILQKYMDFLRPLYRRIRGRRSSSRADHGGGGDSRVHVMDSWVYSAATSPRASVAYSVDDNNWRKSCDSESSIYEAVLHCKRSIGK